MKTYFFDVLWTTLGIIVILSWMPIYWALQFVQELFRYHSARLASARKYEFEEEGEKVQ